MKISRSDLELFISDLYSAALITGNLQTYCNYAFNKVNEYVKIDSASINLCVIKENMKLTDLKCYFFNQPQTMESSYNKIAPSDFFTPVLIGNRFNAFHAMDLISLEEYQETDLFLKHCCNFDVHNSIAAGSRIPGHKDKFLIIYLYSHEPSRLFSQGEVAFLECIFPVLFTAMRCGLDLICADTMKDEMMAVKSICASPERMKLIRYIVNHPASTRKEIARTLNKSISTVDTQLQSIFEKLNIRKDEELDTDKWNLKCELLNKFSFLK